jgi:UDP-N-acetylglucosamine 2-epimerase
MKIVTIVGARPQFIKAAAVTRAIEDHNLKNTAPKITEILVHTGQHYDHNMSQVFFDELEINAPHFNLAVGSGHHGEMTAKMLARIEETLLAQKPDLVLVYGDTNSTLAGALAAVKLHIPVAHVEAGLRSFNRQMPEEINRLLTDHMSIFLFCPTATAVKNLEKEGIIRGVLQVGDVMFDAFLHAKKKADQISTILESLNLAKKQYFLTTVHRQENTDNPAVLMQIMDALEKIGQKDNPIIFPIHPRTKKIIEQKGIQTRMNSHVRFIPPVGYFDMIVLEDNAKIILTDSGGIQKEAYFAEVPCITLRDETEWVETEQDGWNRIAGRQTERIIAACQAALQMPQKAQSMHYGDGTAAKRILQSLKRFTREM